jgi:hypothetical protein
VQNQHAEFIETFNTTPHWAHRQRAAGDRTPLDVLGWQRGRGVESKRLQDLFSRTGFLRTVNRYGFVSVQRFYIYAEHVPRNMFGDMCPSALCGAAAISC